MEAAQKAHPNLTSIRDPKLENISSLMGAATVIIGDSDENFRVNIPRAANMFKRTENTDKKASNYYVFSSDTTVWGVEVRERDKLIAINLIGVKRAI